jgi:hypothetical protein
MVALDTGEKKDVYIFYIHSWRFERQPFHATMRREIRRQISSGTIVLT